MRRVERALASLCLLCACERGPSAPEPPSPGPALAEVKIAAGIVREIARQRGVPLERARELAEEDALLALELTRREPELASSLQRVALARELSQLLLADAERRGVPTDQEVTEVSSERWWELERPRMVQVVHAVVLLKKTEGEGVVEAAAADAAAAALAEQITQAVAGASTDAEFTEAARAVPAGDQTVRVESLLPVTPDGRALDPAKPPPLGPSQRFAVEFAAAAQKLQRVGQISPVVRTPFGYHVLYAQRILEPRQLPLEERRKLVAPEVFQRRALAEQRRILAEQREQSGPQQERSALRSIAQLVVTP